MASEDLSFPAHGKRRKLCDFSGKKKIKVFFKAFEHANHTGA